VALTALLASLLVVTVLGVVQLRYVGGMRRGASADASGVGKKLGDYTGDCLGATQQVSEIGFYLGLLICV